MNMGFWLFMFICNLLIPAAMIVLGNVLLKHPPKDINGIYGYRTDRSMKNMETWNYANKTLGIIWSKIGWVIFVLCIFIQLLFFKSSVKVIGIMSGISCAAQCITLVLSIVPVESALKKHFNPDGSKK